MLRPPDFRQLLRTLCDHQVDFIVIGGVCGVLHGAPVTTFDLDILYANNRANNERLLAALLQLDACYRDATDRVIRPAMSHLAAGKVSLLTTSAGPLDVLGQVGKGETYEAMLAHSEILELSRDCRFRILDLPTLIRLKEELGRSKDRAVLEILRETLARRIP